MKRLQIQIREHDKLHIGVFDSAKPSVTLGQAEELCKLKDIHGFDVFKWINQHMLCAQQYVGTIQIGELTVEILPKIESSVGVQSISMIRHNLVGMLMVALSLDISEGDIANTGFQRIGILEILIRLFCNKLFKQVHGGLVRRYVGQEGNYPVLRGRLAITEQVRFNAANPQRLYCRFDEFLEDIALNQILKAAVRILLKASKDLTNQRQLAELLLVFAGITDVPPSALPWDKISFDRLNERYRASFLLAKLFLKGTPPDVTSGRTSGFSLLFDMNTLFEEYIGRMTTRLVRAKGMQVNLQGPHRFLARVASSGRAAFAMKPDIVIAKESKAICIVDTKWKQLTIDESREGAAQSDLYQMYAYANNYECSDVTLLYPHHVSLGLQPGVRANYQLNRWVGGHTSNGIACVKVATIDLSDLNLVSNQLLALFNL